MTVNLIVISPLVFLITYENIQKGKYSFSRLSQRYKNASLPNYEIVNLNNTKLENAILNKAKKPRAKRKMQIQMQPGCNGYIHRLCTYIHI